MASKPDDTAPEELFPWEVGIYDAHCHPTDTMSSLEQIPHMKARALTVMATRGQDQHLVAQAADKLGATQECFGAAHKDERNPKCMVIPSFGWHPWFSHQVYDDVQNVHEGVSALVRKIDHYKNVITPSPKNDSFIRSLPEPKALSELLSEIKARLAKYPLALVGEIGLDRSFRIPDTQQSGQLTDSEPGLTPGGREGRRLSPYRVDMNHQLSILKAQLKLAGEMRRAVSVHGVAAHGVLFGTLQEIWKGHENEVVGKRLRKKRSNVDPTGAHEQEDSARRHDSTQGKPFPPRICLHSYSGPADHLKQYFNPVIPAVIFVSFSEVINFSHSSSAKAVDAIKVVPDNRILIESDLHQAGERMDGLLEKMTRKICEIKGWRIDEGAMQLARNWRHFVLGLEKET